MVILMEVWGRNIKNFHLINLFREMFRRHGALLLVVQLSFNSINSSITIDVLLVRSTTVSDVDVSITTVWPAHSIKLVILLIKTIKISSISSKEQSSNNVLSVITGWKGMTVVLLWPANVDSSFVMIAEGLPVLMECVLIKIKYHLLQSGQYQLLDLLLDRNLNPSRKGDCCYALFPQSIYTLIS